MIIPFQQLSTDALNGVIESFILREGTDYGAIEIGLTEKIIQVKQQIERGDLVLVFSELHQSITIMPKEHFATQEHY
jgi:hypothetical protein